MSGRAPGANIVERPGSDFVVHNSTRGYSIVSNSILRDARLSIKSRFYLVLILSLPEDWDLSVTGLVHLVNGRDGDGALVVRRGQGRDSVHAALRELEQAGYLVREQERGESGSWERVRYHVFDSPQEAPFGRPPRPAACQRGGRAPRAPRPQEPAETPAPVTDAPAANEPLEELVPADARSDVEASEKPQVAPLTDYPEPGNPVPGNPEPQRNKDRTKNQSIPHSPQVGTSSPPPGPPGGEKEDGGNEGDASSLPKVPPASAQDGPAPVIDAAPPRDEVAAAFESFLAGYVKRPYGEQAYREAEAAYRQRVEEGYAPARIAAAAEAYLAAYRESNGDEVRFAKRPKAFLEDRDGLAWYAGPPGAAPEAGPRDALPRPAAEPPEDPCDALMRSDPAFRDLNLELGRALMAHPTWSDSAARPEDDPEAERVSLLESELARRVDAYLAQRDGPAGGASVG